MAIQVKSENRTYILTSDMLGRGETARVFSAYMEGQGPSQANFAIKLARDQRHNVYIEREYNTLVKLRGAISSPALPNVEIGESTDGRKALIMTPLLRQSLLDVFGKLDEPISRERLAIRAAKQYVDLLQAMVNSSVSCQDRKLADLWWTGEPESGQLIVTDWNVVDDIVNQVADIRRFGLLWFELVIGGQMLRDYQPQRKEFDKMRNKASYGLWYMIGRAVGSSMGPAFRTVQELADSLNELESFYAQPSQALIYNAQANLEAAKTNLDRSKADLAWIQFDIAERLGAGEQTTGIEQACLWAQDPVTQAVPDLLRKLSSPHFSEVVSKKLKRLKSRAQSPQELGDIERLQFGFDLLKTAMRSRHRGIAVTEFDRAQQEFAEMQTLLVGSVLRPLINKNGSEAKEGLERIAQLLGPHLERESSGKLDSLEQEALFWEKYQEAGRNLSESPNLALEALENARRTRALVKHWSPLYEPTIERIDQLKELAESNRRASILAGEAARLLREKEADVFSSALREDIAKRRWGEVVAELVAMLEQNPENDKLKVILEQVLGDLLQKREELAQSRSSPSRLAERAKIIEALLQIPTDIALDLPKERALRRELADICALEEKISQDQKELFYNPGQVLERTLKGGYELFDDVALSATVLKTLLEVGRWDHEKFGQEIDRLEERAEHFKEMTDVLEKRRGEIEEKLAIYEKLQGESVPETRTFFANTLQLYLTTALVQIEEGDSADSSLERVERLLDFARASGLILDEGQYDLYRDIHQHLVEIQRNRQKPMYGYAQQLMESLVTEKRLEEWFKEGKLDDCRKHLESLPNEKRREWGPRIANAVEIRSFIRNGAPHLEKKYSKRDGVEVYTAALRKLHRFASEFDPMAYALYEEELQGLYEQTWRRLSRLHKKAASRFTPNIRNLEQ